ncbi:MAG TPA: patatin-like phospholipase family protein [Streptosporangiaceae bacterium]|nr:patatin-like phospholipase family protein [Streptosporangiaceae bacterium]
MTRAVVLGGGGPVGIGWECGLAAGLAEAGIDLGGADLIVGTSAGSVVGAALALKLDLAVTVDAVSQPLPLTAGGGAGLDAMMTALGGALARGLLADELRAELGVLALATPTVAEDDFAGAPVFAQTGGRDWPAPFRCTAVDTRTGRFQVWDQDSGVPLPRALASSCSVPGVFPPVTIDGTRYMDGGTRTPLNADLAAGHDAVIAVSCMMLSLPEGMSDPVFDAMSQEIADELAAVRDSGSELGIIAPGPEFLEVSGWGTSLMDPSRVAGAYQSGLRQAAAEAGRLREVWAA